MKKDLISLLTSEIDLLENYLERLFFAIFQVKRELRNSLKLRKILKTSLAILQQKLLRDLFNLADSIFNFPSGNDVVSAEKELKDILVFLRSLVQIVHLMPNDQNRVIKIVDIANSFYSLAQELHLLVDPKDLLKIKLPSTSGINISEEEESFPLFYINYSEMEKISSDVNQYFSLDEKRTCAYETLIRQGHNHILEKEYKAALDIFLQALKLKTTTQCLNLIGWTYSLMGNFLSAKEYCLKSIKIGPEHGDAYNDMGSYLLQEGLAQESKDWFELAKRARYLINREFPYVNLGRIYLAQKNYRAALSEFSMALKLVPCQKVLKFLVSKLEKIVCNYEEDISNRT